MKLIFVTLFYYVFRHGIVVRVQLSKMNFILECTFISYLESSLLIFIIARLFLCKQKIKHRLIIIR